ncbi:hypothetical protein BGZ63DRAFT_391364, partial [Mariannaea sp. PMI_226]
MQQSGLAEQMSFKGFGADVDRFCPLGRERFSKNPLPDTFHKRNTTPPHRIRRFQAHSM